MADLIFFHRGQPLLREALESRLSIGRHRDNDVCLLDGVSPFHASVELQDGSVLVSANEGPVFLNGEKIQAAQRLKDGDLFDVGGYRCQFFETTRSLFSPAQSEKTTTSGAETADGAKRGPLPTLHFSAPEPKKFKRSRLLLGRAASCDLILENGFISSQHAEIFFHDGEYRLRDLHSRNGTFLNDAKVTEKALPPQGVIRLGKLSLPFQIEVTAAPTTDIPGVVLPGLRPGEGERMLVGASQAFTALLDRLKKIASSQDAVLLLGETGTGKDVIAHYLHAMHPKRKGGPYVPVNCAAIPQTLAESQLFGHVRGAFSGAQSDHRGFFQEAHKGTLFLDEIGELPLESQARLLRVIEDGYVRPVGATRETPLDVRLIFATNRDLDGARDDGNFREDLFQRFQWIVKIPPLRERREDIPHLIRYFLKKHAPTPLSASDEVLKALQRTEWPGNIRELNRAVRRAIANAIDRGADAVTMGDFELQDAVAEASVGKVSEIRQEKRKSLKKTLESFGGNISHAAKALGVSRVTIHKWIDEDGIDVGHFKV